MLSATLPVGRSYVLSFKSLSLISSAKCLPSPLLAIRENPAARQGALYVENPSNSGCCYCIGQAAVFAVVFSLMDKGNLSHCCDPIRMVGVAVELVRPGLGSSL